MWPQPVGDDVRVIVCGGRDYTDGDAVEAHLRAVQIGAHARGLGRVTVVHGASRGADQLAGVAARALGLDVEEHPADWRGQGRAAGPRRNLAMLAAGADRVLAFPGGKGTEHMVSIAREAGVPVTEVGA